MRRVLVLRPEPGASETLARARDLSLDAFAVPLFEVEAVDWRAPDPSGFDGLLLTSANAVRHGGTELQQLRQLPAFAVGQATAEAAREAGFDVAARGEEGVDRLLGSIDADLRLLHLCGVDRRTPQEARQKIAPIPVYRSCEIAAPDLSAAQACVALIHSPRAGARLAELIRDRGSIAIAAISAAAAETAGEGWESVSVADAPHDEALLALAASLCNKPDPE